MAKIEAKILVVDDDIDVLNTARIYLKQQFSLVQIENDPQNIPLHFERDSFDVVLLDMNFRKGENDGSDGLFWLNKILEIDPNAIVILVTAYGEFDLAVQAIKAGGTDFITKPWKNEKLYGTITSALQLRKSKLEVDRLKNTQKTLETDIDSKYENFLGDSPAMQQVFSLIDKVAPTDATVLILGENGTGKELAARALHKRSKRANKVFIKVDLGSISETLFESELFGHVKGAFTDAKEDKPGRFELASGGTLFLDEIGNLSLPLQAKLLSVLQQRKVSRVGSNKEIPIDIRLVCATNMPLYEMVDSGKFRQDLLYRINTVELNMPSLSERTEDIEILAAHFINVFGKKYNKDKVRIDAATIAKLKKYSWPGNIRELEHAIERAIILADGNKLSTQDFLLNTSKVTESSDSEIMNLSEMEKRLILKALDKHQGNVTRAAKELGIDRLALYRRMQKYGL
ncbi:DNA-binding NtrC family response regulator [Roseivirga pacifica]|uniref:DNA-binding transcriptional response regulator, NtrC family, contains REC, AAA-type ATPase, and a Fis-type DNA-binding domains n=1 Tax=Roseivirga pacifica TaxID=1267423 RepID=A0A1I0QRY9_9BACT|nr:sigma-54 dependent transcriptional regulator [Roseivirga pacifica]RKQ42622.1 DNA-binding NtrC family response regulator [Roseivirga pacifica]SEW30343.1 DNA-binding transcriptional response regulator, NtrC family, contains REC, AAA-type ATPase, and a Fis-type DNA-binding domains [Roseivirga pacifica]